MDVRSLFLFAAFALLAFIGFATADGDFEEGDINFRVRGESGKLFFGRKTKSGKRRDLSKEGFTVEVMYVKQKDNQGRDVGKPVRTLASQTFRVSPFNKSAMFQGVKTAHLDLVAHLKDPQADLTLCIYIFREAGNVTFGNESSEVQKGTIKVFVKVENYTFCDGNANGSICKRNEVGEFLEVAISMRNRKGKPLKWDNDEERKKREGPRRPGDKRTGIRCPKVDRMGRKAKCMTITRIGSDEVGVAEEGIVDGVSKKMPRGFPKFDNIGGGKQRFTFRGAKFNNTIEFDPVIDLDDEDDDDDGDGHDSHATSIQLHFFMFVAILAALFM